MPSEAYEQKLDRILSEILDRREAGEPISNEEAIAAYPEFEEDLREKFKQLEIIQTARQRAEEEIEETIPCLPTDGDRSSVPYSGQQIRHYFLVEQIGAGGFGTVWRAHDSKLECDVAIKIPRKEKMSTEEAERFIREARVSAHLRKHPHIVSVLEADWEDEIAFIASEFIDGESLGDRLELSPIPTDETVQLVITVCDALHHAHEAGIIHRDLKPDNILLDLSETPHVTDFGLAKKESQDVPSEVGQIMGTAAYMSPEQAGGASDQADRRSDVFSLGVMLYEMLTGERPFRGSVPRMLSQIVDQDPPKLRAFDPRIPFDLETICLKCLEKDPDLRYQTMEKLKADLERFQKHQPILARPISTAGKLWRWSKRHPAIPWLSLTLILVTVGAMITAGWMLNRYVETMQNELQTETQLTLIGTASYTTREFKEILEDRIEDVLGMSRDGEIYQALHKWEREEEETQSDAITNLRESAIKHKKTPEKIVFPHEMSDLQRALRNFKNDWATQNLKISEVMESQTKSEHADPYSWFINDKEGFQVARVRMNGTLGDNFRFRSYFTGLPHDLDKSVERESPSAKTWKDNSGIHLSDIFLTDDENAYVIAISAPVYARDEAGIPDKENIIGIAGIFVELGKLTELPVFSNIQDNMQVAIYDARGACGRRKEEAVLIQHAKLEDQLKKIRDEPDPEMRKRMDPLKILTADMHIANPDAESEFVSLSSKYEDPLDREEEWLAVRNRESIAEGIYVITQKRKSAIVDPGIHLRTKMIFLGLSVVGFSAAILIPMWIIILRRVIKE